MSSQQPARLRPFKPVAFGRYTLVAPLATGGMGEIFLARMEGAQGFEKFCVIKKILPHLAAETDFVARFVNEAKTLVKLSHGSIAQVLDMGLYEGDPYIALEHVDGKDLRKIASRMRERNLPPPLTVVLYVMSRVLDALAYAHRKRDDADLELHLVHRDVSPQNVLVSYEGEVKVIDFGLAKSTLSASKTNPSIILGKFLYMSPEQARHQKVDRRSDLYSVGVCLYELVSGKNPFDDVPPGELMARVAAPEIPSLQSRDPLVPPPVSELVAKALSLDPNQRFQTAEEFRGRLLACLFEIDRTAGPETVSKFMRETFSSDYQAERRLLTSLRESKPGDSGAFKIAPPPKNERDMTDPHVAALPPPARPSTRRKPALADAPRITEEILAPGLSNGDVRDAARETPVSEIPAFNAGPVTPSDSALAVDGGTVTPSDSVPAVMGVALTRREPMHTPVDPMAAVKAASLDSKARPPTGDRRKLAPVRSRPTGAPEPLPLVEGDSADGERTDELPAVVRAPSPAQAAPAPRPRAPIGWLVAPVLLLTLGGVAVFFWQVRAQWHAAPAGPPPPTKITLPGPKLPPTPPAVVTAPPPPDPQPPLPELRTDDSDLLAPLASDARKTSTSGKKRPSRRESVPTTTLMREWMKTRLAFEDLERKQSCDLASMKLLCSRYDSLKAEVVASDGDAISQEALLPRVEKFGQLLASHKKANGIR